MRPALFPGGVSDPATKTAVLEAADGLIAVDAASGRELWRSNLAFRPLLAGSGDVLALGMPRGRADAVRIVRLELSTGRVKISSEPIVLPDWVVPDDPDPAAFAVSAQRHGSSLSIAWRATHRDAGGAPPTLPVEQNAVRTARGTATIDLSTGAVTQRQAGPEESLDPRPRVSAPYLRNGIWHQEAWRADGAERLLARSESGSVKLVTGEKQIVLGGLPKPVATVTADGRHVLVNADSAHGGGEWLIFSAVTGDRVGTATYDVNALDPVVMGDRLYFLVRRGQNAGATARFDLEARRFGSANSLWSIPITRRTLPTALPR